MSKIVPAPSPNLQAELEVDRSEVKSKKAFKLWKSRVDLEAMNRWPVQGWSSGNGVGYCKVNAADVKEEAAKENLRVFTMDQESRWPLQGWSDNKPASHTVDLPAKPTSESAGLFNPVNYRTQRWPQGW